MKVIGLETAEEQLAAIANMRLDVATTLLALTARDPGLNDNLYATISGFTGRADRPKSSLFRRLGRIERIGASSAG